MARKAFIGEAYYGYEKPEGAVTEHLIQGLLPRRGLAIIVGEPGKGKSLLSMHLAKCLASGARLVHCEDEETELGLPTIRGSCIFLPGEGYNTYHLRLEAAFLSLTLEQQEELALAAGLPVIHSQVRGIYLKEHFEEIKNKITEKVEQFISLELPPLIVLIDTISSTFFLSNENDPVEAQAILDELAEFAESLNCLIILLAHPSKGKFAKPWEVRGSGVWNGAADVVWLVKQRNRIVSLKVAKGRDGFEEEATFHFKIEEIGKSAFLSPASIQEVAATPKTAKPHMPTMREKVWAAIESLHSRGIPISRANVLSNTQHSGGNLKKDGSPMAQVNFARSAGRALQELADAGKITFRTTNGYEGIYLTASLNKVS